MKVILVDDDEPTTCSQVKTALSYSFAATSVEVTSYKPTTPNWDAAADAIIALSPDVMLTDEYMPQPGDGIELVTALRRSGFAGFTYLWTSSERAYIEQVLRQHALLLESRGAGGFCNRSEAAALAAKVKEDYDACGQSFRVSDPESRVFNPLDAALEILTDLLPLCFSSANRQEIMEHASKAVGGDNTDSTFLQSFRGRVQTYFPARVGELALPSAEVRETYCTLANGDTPNDVRNIACLRDALLRVCQICHQG